MFITLRGGMGQLVQALERALTGGQVVTGARVVGLERRDGVGYRVRTANGAIFEAHALVLATPAYVSAELVSGLVPSLADALGSIRYVSTATISLGFRRADVAHPLDGFGFVVPRREQRKLSACTWTSTKFRHRAPSEALLLRCFVGGPGREELVELSDEELLALVGQELSAIMGLHARPTLIRIFRWHKANPQYDVGHLDRVGEMYDLCETQPGLFITGSAFEGVGLPDCVRQGQQTASKVLSYIANQKSQT
jgi:oxygen-dependent protoporphyrinogen oxidase